MNEILEVEIEMENGEKQSMQIQEADWWNEIEKGTKALMCLVNNQQMLVEINSACEDDGVSFKVIGEERSYHYEASVVAVIYTEINKNNEHI